MKLVCLDLEGVLIPEIWIAVAKKTGIEELKLTTRDIPDYDVLMQKRINILKEHSLTLNDIQSVISEMKPLDGALEFTEEVCSMTQLIILSDTFEEFAAPLMKQLGWPTLFCNNLDVNQSSGMITGYNLRQKDGKRKAIEAFRSINYQTIAAGDSYNDLTMIKHADKGLFFRPPQSIVDENPEIEVVMNHKDLLVKIKKFL